MFTDVRTSKSLYQGVGFGAVETAQRNMVGSASETPNQMRQSLRPPHFKIAIGPKNECALKLIHHERKHSKGRRIGIVKVIQYEQQRSRSYRAPEYCCDGVKKLELSLCRIAAGWLASLR